MPKRKRETTPAPSEATVQILEPASGITDITDARLEQVAVQFLNLPQGEQIAAAQWMGSQPQYATLLGYLVDRLGVTGAVRRAVKRAIFELRRQGVRVATVTGAPVRQELVSEQSPSSYTVEQAFAAVSYDDGESRSPLHLRFFLREASGDRHVFALDIGIFGYLLAATWVDEGVQALYEECVQYPFDPNVRDEEYDASRNEFVAVPVDWAVQVAHEARQRNLRDQFRMPAHAAFYWGRLPEPPEPPVPHPIDSIPDAETGWLVSSLVTPAHVPADPLRIVRTIGFYMTPPDVTLSTLEQAIHKSDRRIVLPTESQEQRQREIAETWLQTLFPDEKLRDALLNTLPVHGSIYLLGGDRATALWCKAIWRELNERRDKPFWQTAVATIIAKFSHDWLRLDLQQVTNIDLLNEEETEDNESST